MYQIKVSDRILFLLTALVAGIKIVNGMDHHTVLSIWFYTVSLGILVLASLLLLLFGYELLSNRFVPVVTTLIPTALSIGLVHDHLPQMTLSYGVLLGVIYLISVWVRFTATEKTAALVLALTHGISGLLVFVLPIVLYSSYGEPVRLLFVSLGGVIIGSEGIVLTLQKIGFRKVKIETIFAWFSIMLFAATVAFVGGLSS
ncbi:MAG TPA: hypothetical protein ENJ89_11890 [Caldithrix abyssi]|uniref:Uncharacterized protein n=1 Tax=Caldithrix abyssi TaxID=187145 RepID=A0A7V5UG49_CALAY|nr:hypothetical protein [Caldithrix abyssi]